MTPNMHPIIIPDNTQIINEDGIFFLSKKVLERTRNVIIKVCVAKIVFFGQLFFNSIKLKPKKTKESHHFTIY